MSPFLSRSVLIKPLVIARAIIFTSFFALSITAQSQTEAVDDFKPPYDADKAHEQFLQFTESLKKTQNAAQKPCGLPSVKECRFSELCKNIDQNANQVVLYKNTKGETYSNYRLVEAINYYGQCGEKEVSPELMKMSPLSFASIAYLPPENPSAEYKKIIETIKKQTADKAPKIAALFKQSQKDIIAFLQERITPQNKNQIEKVIERVSKIKFKPAQFDDESQIGSCLTPNAYFDEINHTVTICPQLYESPEATIEHILYHEIGHSFDPCALSQDSGSYAEYSKTKPFPIVSIKESPFKETISCLSSNKSMGFKPNSYNEILKKYEDNYRETFNSYQEQGWENAEVKYSSLTEMAEAQMLIQERRDTPEQIEACYFGSGSRRYNESFAEWVSSQMVGRKIKTMNDPAEKARYASEAQLLLTAGSCASVDSYTAKNIPSQLRKYPELKKCLDYYEQIKNEQAAADEADYGPPILTHPTDEARSNRLFLVQPDVQKALGCTPLKDTRHCK